MAWERRNSTTGTTRLLILALVALWVAGGLVLPWLAHPGRTDGTSPAPTNQAPDTQAQRGQFGDQFGAINALFSALALAGVIYTLITQAQDRSDEKFSERLDRLVAHYAQFSQSRFYRDARGLAWCAAQLACANDDFRRAMRWYWSVAGLESEPDNRKHSHLLQQMIELAPGMLEDATTNSTQTVALAVHRLDDVMTFFQVLEYEISRCAKAAATQERKALLRETIKHMNIYWDEWGPVLRLALAPPEPDGSKPQTLPAVVSHLDRNPNWEAVFDSIDYWYYGLRGYTRVAPLQFENTYEQPSRADAMRRIADILTETKSWRFRLIPEKRTLVIP